MNKQIVFRNTANHKGRKIIMSNENSELFHLSVGRIIVDKEMPPIRIDTGEREFSFICLHGNGMILHEEKFFEVKPFDAVYIPRDSSVKIVTDSHLDLAECSAPVTKKYEPIHIKFDDIKNDEKLHMSLGGTSDKRELYTLIGDNVKSGRLFNGVTFSAKGNWTSWPPHEHTQSREEVYLYFDMPKPAFGIQCLYTDELNTESFIPVFENDAVVVTNGYHPNVSIPGHSINFVWMLCAIREDLDRQWTGSKVQLEYKQ